MDKAFKPEAKAEEPPQTPQKEVSSLISRMRTDAERQRIEEENTAELARRIEEARTQVSELIGSLEERTAAAEAARAAAAQRWEETVNATRQKFEEVQHTGKQISPDELAHFEEAEAAALAAEANANDLEGRLSVPLPLTMTSETFYREVLTPMAHKLWETASKLRVNFVLEAIKIGGRTMCTSFRAELVKESPKERLLRKGQRMLSRVGLARHIRPSIDTHTTEISIENDPAAREFMRKHFRAYTNSFVVAEPKTSLEDTALSFPPADIDTIVSGKRDQTN